MGAILDLCEDQERLKKSDDKSKEDRYPLEHISRRVWTKASDVEQTTPTEMDQFSAQHSGM
jgi:hypothetical protein